MKMEYFAKWDKSKLTAEELKFIQWAESFYDYQIQGSDSFTINDLIEAFKAGIRVGDNPS